MSHPQSFRTTLNTHQMEILEEWLRNFNGAAESKEHEWTIQQAFDCAIGRGLDSFVFDNAEVDQALANHILLPFTPKEIKPHDV